MNNNSAFPAVIAVPKGPDDIRKSPPTFVDYRSGGQTARYTYWKSDQINDYYARVGALPARRKKTECGFCIVGDAGSPT